MEINSSIQHLGFSEKEAAIYLTLLGLGQASVYLVAKHSGLKRPTTYVIIDELIKKGAVTQVPRSRKQLYIAKPPEELIAAAENRLALVKQKLPELQALIKGRATKPRVYYYEGLEGTKQTLEYGMQKMQDKELVGFYATVTQETLEKFDYYRDYWQTIGKLNVSVRGFAPEDPILDRFREADAAAGRKMKRLSTAIYSPTVSIEIGDTFIKIGDHENLQGVVMENPGAAKLLRQIFELVWQSQ